MGSLYENMGKAIMYKQLDVTLPSETPEKFGQKSNSVFANYVDMTKNYLGNLFEREKKVENSKNPLADMIMNYALKPAYR